MSSDLTLSNLKTLRRKVTKDYKEQIKLLDDLIEALEVTTPSQTNRNKTNGTVVEELDCYSSLNNALLIFGLAGGGLIYGGMDKQSATAYSVSRDKIEVATDKGKVINIRYNGNSSNYHYISTLETFLVGLSAQVSNHLANQNSAGGLGAFLSHNNL